jgi:hypothetical protein
MVRRQRRAVAAAALGAHQRLAALQLRKLDAGARRIARGDDR